MSLGELSAVGNLMGRLIGGSLLIQGLIARWMYVSLYKLHQIAIHGVPARGARHGVAVRPAPAGTAGQAALRHVESDPMRLTRGPAAR